jgi:hypothetical protein
MASAGRARRYISTSRYRAGLFTAQKNTPVREYYGLATVVGGPIIVGRDLIATVVINTAAINTAKLISRPLITSVLINASAARSVIQAKQFSASLVLTPIFQKNTGFTESSVTANISLTHAALGSTLKTRSTTLPITITPVFRVVAIKNSSTVIPVSIVSVLQGVSSIGSQMSLNVTLSPVGRSNRVQASRNVSTISFNLPAVIVGIKARNVNPTLNFIFVGRPQSIVSAAYVSPVEFRVSPISDVAAVVTDPDDEIKLAALHDIRNRYFRSNVVEKSLPLAAFASESVEFPYSSIYLQFFVGFVSSDVPGVLKLERKLTEDSPWFTVRTWLVTNSVQFVEQIMTGYTRMVLVNADVPQTRLMFKAEIYGKKDDILST